MGGASSQNRHVLEHIGLVELVIQVQNLFLDGTVVVQIARFFHAFLTSLVYNSVMLRAIKINSSTGPLYFIF